MAHHRVSLNGTGITSGLDFGLVQQNPRPQSMRSPIRRPSTKTPYSKRYSSAESVPASTKAKLLS